MSDYYEENRSFSGPLDDSPEQFDCSSTTELSPPLISPHDEKWPQNDSFESDPDELLTPSNFFVYKKIKEEDKAKRLHHLSILDDLIEDAVLEVCFESHRIAKLCSKANGKNQSYDKKSKKSIFCYICKSIKGYDKFSKHLCDCFSLTEGHTEHRKAKAKANYSFKETEFDDEDYGDLDDDERSEKKKGSRGKYKPPGSSLLKPSYNNSPKYEHMSFDEKKKFLDQKCGVISKRSRKPCMNTTKCTAHTQIERDTVRNNYLGVKNDETDCIDVDTIDDVILPSFGVSDGSTSILSSYFGSSAFP